MTSTQTAEEQKFATALVEALNLEHIDPAGIVPTAPLFGFDSERRGLGLDSIDALEIALMIKQRYGVEIRSEDPGVKKAFASLRDLTTHVIERRPA